MAATRIAKAPRGKATATKRDLAGVESRFQKLKRAPAVITHDELTAIENHNADATNHWARRAALATLSLPGKKLFATIKAERDYAIAFAQAAGAIDHYVLRLRMLTEMLESASTRIKMAMCDRADAGEIWTDAANRAIPTLKRSRRAAH